MSKWLLRLEMRGNAFISFTTLDGGTLGLWKLRRP